MPENHSEFTPEEEAEMAETDSIPPEDPGEENEAVRVPIYTGEDDPTPAERQPTRAECFLAALAQARDTYQKLAPLAGTDFDCDELASARTKARQTIDWLERAKPRLPLD
jgi:hypothetical protein